MIIVSKEHQTVKPIVKWLGGKRLLLPELRKRYPRGLGDTITTYVEPFVGGGAVLLDVLSNYKMDEVYISDANASLVNMYMAVRDCPDRLVSILEKKENIYHPITQEKRNPMYYDARVRYNEVLMEGFDMPSVDVAALFIFLNKTCFNGLYRINKKGLFNASVGFYRAPAICESDNMFKVSNLLQGVNIIHRDYKLIMDDVNEYTFAYFDPPYRPTSEGHDFASYTRSGFNDDDQIELADMLYKIDKIGGKFMMSNSDPRSGGVDDDFFDELYSSFNIERVDSHRGMRGFDKDSNKICTVSEILVTNYTDYDTSSNP